MRIPPAPKADAAAASGTAKADATESAADRGPVRSTALPPPERSYTVQPGEGWYTLAQRFLGNGNDWPELYELNRERVSNNPHLLRVGTVIELPLDAKRASP